MINTNAKSTLAKLLAKENIEVREGNYQTAAFDVENRVLLLPLWKDMGKDVYDLLVGHEVGHALFTPSEGWHNSDIDVEGIPRSYLNVIEDIRIERAIQRQYPGLVASFKRGYQVLFDEDFFGTADRPMESYQLPDRINIKAKLADLISIPFTAEEAPLVKQCFSVTTWEEVVAAARALYEFMKEKQEEKPNEESESNEQDGSPTSNMDSNSNPQPSDSSEDESETEDKAEGSEAETGDEADESDAQPEDDTKGDSDKAEMPVSVEYGYDRPEEDITVIETDDTFRSSEDKLLEGEGNTQPAVITEFSNSDIKNAVISYKEVFAAREETFELYGAYFNKEQCDADFDTFLNDNDRVVKTMVKEFEMRKAAYRYSRATTSKTGSLDTLKMHSYKYNEDIFARATKLADSKNHGMIMLVDYSGSMQNTIAQIQRQVIVLSMFCRKVNIPFKVYGFTSGSNNKQFTTNLQLENLMMFELLTNEMSKSDFDKAVYQIYTQSWEMSRSQWSRPAYLSDLEYLGGTPLNEALLVLHKIVPAFKRQFSLDKVNLTVLTDGSANNMYLNYDRFQRDMIVDYKKISVAVGNKRMVLNQRACTAILIDEMRKQYDVTTLGYYIPGGGYDFRNEMYRCGVVAEETVKERRREFMKQKFTSFDDVLGFDRYFVLRSGKDIDTKTEEFDVMDGAKKGELTRQFKKFAGSKKGNRVLATRFAEMVA